MSRYSGRQGRGAAKITRDLKHEEAMERNAKTPVERTRAYRLNQAKENKS